MPAAAFHARGHGGQPLPRTARTHWSLSHAFVGSAGALEIVAAEATPAGLCFEKPIYDHLIDSYRDLLSGATDLYLSTVSNRQNDVMKQLTVIATIFLPLGFITGVFGQNFAFLVTHLIN